LPYTEQPRSAKSGSSQSVEMRAYLSVGFR
jgi:hypothetical protein